MLENNPTEKWWKRIGEKTEVKTISYSSANTMQNCGLQWRLKYVDKIEMVKPQLWAALGSSFHTTMKPVWLYGKAPKFRAVWEKYKRVPIEYKEKESWLMWQERGDAMTQALAGVLLGKFDKRRTKVEVPDPVKLGGVILLRYIDVITVAKKMPIIIDGKEQMFSGSLHVDMKTAAQRYSLDSIARSQQLMTYEIPSKKIQTPDLSAYAVVTKAVDPKVQLIGRVYAKEEIQGQIVRLKSAVDRIAAGDFTQQPGDACNRCDFVRLCFKHPDALEAYRVRRNRSRNKSANADSTDGDKEA